MIKKYLVLILAMSFIVGCNDDATESFQDKKNESILKVESPEEFSTVIEKMLNASNAELEQFEKQKGFTSYRSILNKAYAELVNIESKEGLSTFLTKYKDIVTWEDDQVRPIIRLPLYQRLANEDGFFETHGLFNKVTAEYVYTVNIEDKHLLDDINFEEDIKSKKVTVSNYTFSQQNESSARYPDGTCPRSYSQRGVYNPSGCNSDRDLVISVETYQVCGFLHNGTPLCGQVVGVEAVTSRKNWYCEWYNYVSTVTFQNMSYQLDGIEGVFTIPDTYIDENSSFHNFSSVAFLFPEPVMSPIPGFNQIHIEATSRGLNGIWIVMDNPCD
jgi:hypothetical protein